MRRRPPRSTRTDTLFPYTTLCRSSAAREAAVGIGMSPAKRLLAIELPLAAPIVLAGIRTSVTINIGTAAIASTVGAKTLGTPIIVGLNGSNIAYVLQGAILTGLLAIVVDLALGRLATRLQAWTRSEERRVGKECVSTCRSRWSPYH